MSEIIWNGQQFESIRDVCSEFGFRRDEFARYLEYGLTCDADLIAHKQNKVKRPPIGSVARRLRELDMVTNVVGQSIRGVYTGYDMTGWESLDVFQRAMYEGRILGGAVFKVKPCDTSVFIIARNKFEDNAGYKLLVKSHSYAIVIALTTDYAVTTSYVFRGDDSCFDRLPEISGDALADMIENFEYGLRVESWMKVLMEMVEIKSGYVSEHGFTVMFHEWQTLAQSEAA